MQEKLLNDHVIKVEQCIENILLNYDSNSLFLLDKSYILCYDRINT